MVPEIKGKGYISATRGRDSRADGKCKAKLDPEKWRAYLLRYSRFEEIERLMEAKIPGLSSAKTKDLYYLCRAYAGLKKYNKLFSCLDQMERNIAQGDAQWFDGRLGVKEWRDASYYPSLWRAQAYAELGNFDQAISPANRVIALTETSTESRNALESPAVLKAEAQGLLGVLHASLGHRDEAQKFVEAIETSQSILDNFEMRITKATQLTKMYLALGDFERAYKSAQSSVGALDGYIAEVMPGEEGESWQTELISYQNFFLSKSAYETKRVGEAKKGYDELLDHPRIKSFGELYWVILFDRGRIEENADNRKGAIPFYTRAVEVIEQQRSTINTEISKIGFVGDKQRVYHRLVAALVAEGQPAQAFEYVERAKARALVDLLASKQDFAASIEASQKVVALVKDWDQVEEESRVPAVSSEESGRRSARGVQVKANLQAVSPELASLVMVTETASSAVQALLEPDETLLEYYYQDDDLYAFVVTRETVKGAKLNGANLAKEVEEFRKALEDPKSDRMVELSRNLYGLLVQPVAAQVTTKRLLIVGHGVLHYLPFAALSDGTGYLVDRYSLRLLPSASVLQFLKGRQAQKSGSLLAFGNPDLGDAQYDLKFAQDEVQTIAKGFPNAKVLVRQEATKSAFKSLGPQFSYLHLATHGKFDPDAPLKSGLLLAKDSQGDGFLSLGDLYSLRLNADLVTLSACETGLGKLHNGDDAVGLTRGFLYAGSSSIVASLWQVDDRATSLLMTEFYANLKKGDKREALRQAQLTAKQQFPHPFYWAAFQLTGMP